MRGNALIQMLSGRYHQGRGVIGKLGEEALLLGRRAHIIADEAAWAKFGGAVLAPLDAAGIASSVFTFTGLCSPEHYDAAAKAGEGAQLVIGVGGGRAMDASKIAADKLGVRVICVPTSASTCASTAWLSVHYENDGPMIGNYWSRYSPFATIAELDFIALDCPPRLMAAGILDAMAKYPEITYNIRHLTSFEVNAFSHTAAGIAKDMFFYLLQNGEEAIRACQRGEIGQREEDVICYAIAVAGLTSVLACGGKQAAVSHSLYASFCSLYPELAHRFVHGELVSASMPYQMAVTGIEQQTIDAYAAFARAFGSPVCLTDLGLAPDEAAMDAIFEDLRRRMPVQTQEEYDRLRSMQALLIRYP